MWRTILIPLCVSACAMAVSGSQRPQQSAETQPPEDEANGELTEESPIEEAGAIGPSPVAPEWRPLALKVGKADVQLDHRFHQSMQYWTSGFLSSGDWTVKNEGDLTVPVSIRDFGSGLIDGNCAANVTLQGGVLHVLGNLESLIVASSHGEVIIGGDVAPNARIVAKGIVSIFVGGDLRGEVVADGSTCLWVEGSVSAKIQTGNPVTRLHVGQDLMSIPTPSTRGLLFIDVDGYMSGDALSQLARLGYTLFNVSVGKSNLEPGIYDSDGRGYWVVHSRGEPSKDQTDDSK